MNADNVEKGIKSMTVNGISIEGNVIPYDASQTKADVVIVMG